MKVSLLCLTLFLIVSQAKALDHFKSDNIKEQEVLSTWKLYFEDWGVDNPSPKRTKHFRDYARYVVKWTKYYETYNGNFGGRLPKYKDNHLLVAVMIQKETGIRPNVVGKLGEVGLMQIWGDPLDGHKRREVKNNPELGIKLGIQWLAYSTTLCKKPKKWRKYSWLKPLTQYGAGPKAKVNGKCEIYSFARRRVNKTLKYRKQINKREVK